MHATLNFLIEGKLEPSSFDISFRTATHDLADLLLAATRTESASVESTHFLMVLAKVPAGVTISGLQRRGLTAEQWDSGLIACANKGDLPPAHLTSENLHPSAHAALEDALRCCEKFGLAYISEGVLLLSSLRHATKEVRELCSSAGINLEDWTLELLRQLEPTVYEDVFDAKGVLVTTMFGSGAKKVLGLLRGEAESLGYATMDGRHLLLALLIYERGATHYGLHQQGLLPRKIHEAVMLSLRARAKAIRTVLAANSTSMQPTLVKALKAAAKEAARDRAPLILEPHLLRGFLSVESQARGLLADQNVDLLQLQSTAESYDAPEDEEDSSIADIKTVRERLEARVVGQSDAISRILPYVQRMRYGFTTPGRPIGVFLFCGQSGSGKTEMAKGLARAVYGSEDNIVFLEMSQFNSPESMNIFVGAPPGYVGYGEGKLTNGLRDKPRSVVLFDEMEKAVPKVLDALLRFLDEGKIDDPAGPVRDGSGCIAILTSNIGAGELSKLWDRVAGDPNWRTIVRRELREAFKAEKVRPEFLNRVDEIILFRTLTQANYAEIARRLLQRDLDRLRKEKEIDVVATPGIPEAIGQYCAAVAEGARAAQRLTQAMVITPIIAFVEENACERFVRLKVCAVQPAQDPDSEPIGVVQRA